MHRYVRWLEGTICSDASSCPMVPAGKNGATRVSVDIRMPLAPLLRVHTAQTYQTSPTPPKPPHNTPHNRATTASTPPTSPPTTGTALAPALSSSWSEASSGCEVASVPTTPVSVPLPEGLVPTHLGFMGQRFERGFPRRRQYLLDRFRQISDAGAGADAAGKGHGLVLALGVAGLAEAAGDVVEERVVGADALDVAHAAPADLVADRRDVDTLLLRGAGLLAYCLLSRGLMGLWGQRGLWGRQLTAHFGIPVWTSCARTVVARARVRAAYCMIGDRVQRVF